jgi:hypothetical protein
MSIDCYLGGNRLKHTLTVMEKARLRVNRYAVSNFDRHKVLKIAELHDVGYADCAVGTGFHPLDGYLFVKGAVSAEIALGVLLHSDSVELVRYLDSSVIATFEQEYREALSKVKEVKKALKFVDVVSLCDMLTDSTGKSVTLAERYDDIATRYGDKDYRSIVMKNNMAKYADMLQSEKRKGERRE